MTDWGGRGVALCMGLGLGLIFANLVPAPPGRWVFMVPATLWCFGLAFVWPWLQRRYRIVRVDTSEQVGR